LRAFPMYRALNKVSGKWQPTYRNNFMTSM
jgi:hypothetical protein